MAEQSVQPQPRRSFLRLAGAALALALAGCQTVVPRAEAPVQQPIPQRPVTGMLPEDQERHRVALLVPMTGPNAAVGQSIANAANLAILDTNTRKIRITTYDTGPGAAVAAGRAVADGNRLILGPLLAEDVRAVAPTAQRAGVPVISFSNDASVAGKGSYLMGFSPTQSIERVVAFARSRGMTRFAGLVPSGVYGRNASNTLIRAAEAAGGSVVALQTYDRSTKSLSAAVQKLDPTQGFDAILIADGGRIAIQAVPLVRRRGFAGARVLGTELWATEPSLAASPAMRGAWFAAVPDTMYRQLSAKYRARFGRGPYRLASLGYDAVLLTVRIAGDWKVGDDFPARRLNDADGFAGVDGAFRFRDGIAERALAVQEIGAGGFSSISPAPKGFRD